MVKYSFLSKSSAIVEKKERPQVGVNIIDFDQNPNFLIDTNGPVLNVRRRNKISFLQFNQAELENNRIQIEQQQLQIRQQEGLIKQLQEQVKELQSEVKSIKVQQAVIDHENQFQLVEPVIEDQKTDVLSQDSLQEQQHSVESFVEDHTIQQDNTQLLESENQESEVSESPEKVEYGSFEQK